MNISKEESLLIEEIERQRREKADKAEKKRQSRARWWYEHKADISISILTLAIVVGFIIFVVWIVNSKNKKENEELEIIKKTAISLNLQDFRAEVGSYTGKCGGATSLWMIRYVKDGSPVVDTLCCTKGICTHLESGKAF